ncbi:MAG TPA: protein kinase, partial [Blastocatellia bacterium]|nr:protein kinase [Blastocatellia bacterium]
MRDNDSSSPKASPPDSLERPAAEATVELQIPETPEVRRVGRYKLIKKIGAGGMGEIFLGEDERLNRKVALKLLPAEFTQDADRVRRFELEAKAASALNHPNIITIYEIGEADGVHYIVTEHIQGETLRQQMVESLTIDTALDVVIQIASALKAAHEVGIVHRDIKPENVMVRPDGLVKVLDFGIAKLIERPSPPQSPAVVSNQQTVAVDADDIYATNVDPFVTTPAEALNETAAGIIMGTVTYMSPEQLRGQKVDARADIFSLGVVLYEVIAGTSPFAGNTQADRIAAILGRDPAPLAEYQPEVPSELQRIVSKALRKDRDARYQAIEELLVDLKALKQESDFQSKLERSSDLHRGALAGTGSLHANEGSKTQPIQTSHATEQTTSSAEILLSGIREHKRGALLMLTTVIAAIIAVGYFAYTRAARGGSGITSIAVLPFRNLSNDVTKEYLSDGIAESLINRISQLPGLKVIANSSSSRYKGKDADLREVARALDATGILTGRISQLGDKLSISVELIDARDNTQVWGEQYNRQTKDLLSVEEEISSDISDKLRVRLATGSRHDLATPVKTNPEAYELLLKGRFYRSRGKIEDWKKASEYFEQAIAVDPAYAPAYADLSDMYKALGSADPAEYFPKAMAATQRALELDEGLAEAHYALANLKRDAWAWADAEREYERAIELNPNLALAHRWYASYLRVMGRFDQAIAEIKRARELDPLSLAVNANVGQTLYYARQYDQAIEALKTTRELDQRYSRAPLYLGQVYAAKGMYPEAIAEYQTAVKLGLDTPTTQIFLGVAYAQSGERERAQALLQQLQTSKEYVSPGELAILLAALGQRDQAFAS